jgi:hypothetical protein
MNDFVEKRVSDTVYEFKAIARGSSGATSSTSSSSSISSLSRHRGFVFLFCVLVAVVGVASMMQDWIAYQLCVVVIIILFLIGWSMLTQVTEESVLIIRDFGIQLQAKYATGAEETKFLDKDKISGVIIHEYIRGSSVRYGLAFLVRGDGEGGVDAHRQQSTLSLSFGHLYPGLENLTKVYRACAEMIQTSVSSGAGGGNMPHGMGPGGLHWDH